MLKIAAVCLLVAGVAVAEDSPLVAAAKRTNRANPKAKVITNETVTQSKGRLSVASGTQKPIVMPSPSAPSTERKPATATAQKTLPATTQRKDYQPPGYVAPIAINPVAPMGIAPLPETASVTPQSSQVPTTPVSSQQPKP